MDIDVSITRSAKSKLEAPMSTFYKDQQKSTVEAARTFEEAIDSIRKRGDVWGKGVLGIGTTLITAIGIEKLVDLLPVGDDWQGRVAIGCVGLGFVVAVGCVVWIGITLARVNEPLVMRANIDDIQTLRRAKKVKKVKKAKGSANPSSDNATKYKPVQLAAATKDVPGSEYNDVDTIYERFKVINGEDSVNSYLGVAVVLELALTLIEEGVQKNDCIIYGKVEERLRPYKMNRPRALNLIQFAISDPVKAAERASYVRADVRLVMSNAAAVVVRRRMVEATSNTWTKVFLFVIPIALVGALVAADWAKSTHDLEEQKACVDIAAVIAEKGVGYELPDCNLAPKGDDGEGITPDPGVLSGINLQEVAIANYRKCVETTAPEKVALTCPTPEAQLETAAR